MATAKEIWQTLSAIDVSGKTEKKGKLTYLSWTWAWGALMESYPQAKYTFNEDHFYSDGTVMVSVIVEIDEVSRHMWLPVMDNRNNSITNPTSRQISDTRMRCLTKCLAMFGLGHFVYAGEDLPEAVKQEKQLGTELWNKFRKSIKDDDPWLMAEVAERMNDDQWKASYNSFKENITEQKKNVDRLLSAGRAKWNQVCEDRKQNIADGHENGMVDQLVKDIPNEYWRNRLKGMNDE